MAWDLLKNLSALDSLKNSVDQKILEFWSARIFWKSGSVGIYLERYTDQFIETLDRSVSIETPCQPMFIETLEWQAAIETPDRPVSIKTLD